MMTEDREGEGTSEKKHEYDLFKKKNLVRELRGAAWRLHLSASLWRKATAILLKRSL